MGHIKIVSIIMIPCLLLASLGLAVHSNDLSELLKETAELLSVERNNHNATGRALYNESLETQRASKKLNTTRQELLLANDAVRNKELQVQMVRGALNMTLANLSLIRTELSSKDAELSSMSRTLQSRTWDNYRLNQDLSNKTTQITSLLSIINMTYGQYMGMLLNLTELKEKYSQVNEELNETNDLLNESMRYYVHDPTMAELEAFLYNDTTETHPYVDPSYVCINFAGDLKQNAMDARIRCGFICMNFVTIGHAINVFNTTDYGFVFIDQTNYGDSPVDAPILNQPWMFIWEPVQDFIIAW
jgi:hypothetical protein